jgi:calcium-dependent protein kinase
MVTKDNQIKLVDFGLSKQQDGRKRLKTIAGTPYYMSPEMVNNDLYNNKVDIWSLGVMLYVFISGYMPFSSKKRHVLFNQIKKGEYHMDHEEFTYASDEVKDLIGKMLEVTIHKRISATDALKHPWFKVEKF